MGYKDAQLQLSPLSHQCGAPSDADPQSPSTPHVPPPGFSSTDNKRVLKCVSCNCLSPTNKILELRQLVSDQKPNILTLTETWLSDNVSDGEISIPGFSLIRQDSSRGRAGGVIVYFDASLPPPVILTTDPIPLVDSLWIKFQLSEAATLLLGVVYRPPQCTAIESQTMVNQMRVLAETCPFTHLLITGDFNAPSVDWQRASSSDESFGQQLVNLLSEKSWMQHVTLPTRFRLGQAPSLLDLVITNEVSQIDLVHQLSPLGKSDHVTLLFDFYVHWNFPVEHTQEVRSFKRTNFDEIRNFLDMNFSCLPAMESVDSLTTHIELLITQADRQFVPRIQISPNSKPPLPRSIRRLLDERSRLFARYKLTCLESDGLAFKQVRNLCRSRIREYKAHSQRAVLLRARNDKPYLFKYIRRLRKATPPPLALNGPNGLHATSPQQVAGLFRSHFQTIYSSPPVTNHPILPPFQVTSTLGYIHFSEENVASQLRRLNPYCSMGPDKLHPRILKETADTLAGPYTFLFRRCMDEGVFPDSWKEAIISPIFKKGSRLDPVSYRPISLTSISSKIFERIIKEAILAHLRSNGIISPTQHGFIPGRSCITNMLTVMDSLTKAHDDGVISQAVFIDFAKAFDKVPHIPLIHKMAAYGIVDPLLSLIRNFLSNRSFSVKVGNTLSEPSPVTTGVPQGSVLGPLLFLVYINDLPSVVSSNMTMYADDVTIWSTDASLLQASLDATKRWSVQWSLPINNDKCLHMSFGGPPPHPLTIDTSREISRVDQHKVLGFWLNSNLSFSFHNQLASKAAFRVLNLIKRSFPRITREDFPFIYGTYIRPILEYGSQIVHSGLMRDQKLLERVQRSATKVVVGLHHLPYQVRLQELNLYPLEVRRIRGDLFLMFHLFQTNTVEEFFTLADPGSTRGHCKKIYKPRPRTFLRASFLTFRIISTWNSLPEEIVTSSNKTCFKAKLDLHLGLRHPTQ